MAKFKFGDQVKNQEGREALVQEDQEEDSADVKIMYEGDDYAHILTEDKLEKIEAED